MKIQNHFTQANTTKLFIFLACFYFIFALLGGINQYSPVPYFDMWDGYINFYIKATQGDVNAWWALHNEHRIVLSKILFWLDITLFNGQSLFLILFNYFLAGLAFFIIYKILQYRLPSAQDKFTKNIISLVIFCLLFSWLQSGNFTWAFQSQFFLAQIIPLTAFFLLYKAYESKTQNQSYFIYACLAGLVAVGTMGNGLLALPLMAVLAVFLRMRIGQVTALCLLAIFSFVAYFQDYVSPMHNEALGSLLLANPLGILQFLLLYLGSPFEVIFGNFMIMLAGLFFIACAIGFTWHALKTKSALEFTLLTFILFVGGSALVTAATRLIFGLDHALTGRYTTPTLMAWSVLLVLFAPMLAKQVQVDWRRILPLIVIPLILLPAQFKATHSTHGKLFEREIAVLALELGIKDEKQLRFIYPNMHVVDTARAAVEQNLSVFGHPNIKDVADLIGQSRQPIASACIGHLDNPRVIAADDQYVQITGWLFNPANKTIPAVVYLLNTNYQIVGYAITGQDRPDAELAQGKKANASGFKGYLLAPQAGHALILQGQQACEWQVPGI